VTEGELFVAGTRSFAAEVAGFAEDAGLRVAGLLEPYDRDRVGQIIHGLPVTWLEDTSPEGRAVVVGTGENARRDIVDRLVSAGWALCSVVHPQAHLAATSTVGTGALVGPGVVVGAFSTIGDNVVLGRGVLVGHHTEIGPYATVCPGANVAGNVTIEPDAFIGMGALVRDHVTVGAAAVVAMGAVVIGDVPPNVKVQGLPARVEPPAADPA
jgi:sugar O-acyltransferase (sialic acid O-acetyltransferase NeuD family)